MLVSIVIVTKNRINFLKKSLNSAMNQTYKKKEIIVVDDGSNDDTKYFLNAYADKYSNFIYIRNNKSMGANYSRNIGFKCSKGLIVAYLDDDDFWFNDKLEKQMDIMTDNSVDIVTCNFEYNKFLIKYNSNIPSICSLKRLLKENYLRGMSGIVLRKESFKEGLFDINLPSCQDWDFWIRNILEKKKIKIHQSNLYKYTIHSNNKITNNLKNSYKGRKIFFLKYHGLFKKKLRNEKIYELLIMKSIIYNKFFSFMNILINLNTGMSLRLRISYIIKFLKS